MEIDEKKLNYLAGLFDGEGSFSITLNLRYTKSRPWLNIMPTARIGMKKAESQLTDLRDLIGVGKIYCSNKGKDKEIISWQTTQWEEVLIFAATLRPYLKFKQTQAEKIIKVCHLYLLKEGDGFRRTRGLPTRDKEVILEIIKIAINLNPDSLQAQKRKEKKPLEYWEKIVNEIYDYRQSNSLNKGGMPKKYSDEYLLKEVKRIETEGYSWKKDRKWKELVKYRFGSWSKAVSLI